MYTLTIGHENWHAPAVLTYRPGAGHNCRLTRPGAGEISFAADSIPAAVAAAMLALGGLPAAPRGWDHA